MEIKNTPKTNILLAASAILFLFLIYQNIAPFIFIALTPLLMLINSLSIKQTLISFTAISLIFAFASFTWLLGYSWDVYAAASLGFASYIILFAVLTKLLLKYNNSYLTKILAPPFVWVLLYYTYSFTPIGSFWAEWAVFIAKYTSPLVQYIGGSGFTFLIILFNSSLAAFFITKKDKIRLRINKPAIITISIMLAISAFSIAYDPNFDGDKQIKAAALQGNFNQPWAWRISNIDHQFIAYKNLTFGAIDKGAELIVWPEFALPKDIVSDKNNPYFESLKSIAEENNITLVVGSLVGVDALNHHDSALIFTPDGYAGYYGSVEPVYYNDYTVPDKLKTFNILDSNPAITICYEEYSPKTLKEYAKNSDTGFILSLSNDQHITNSIGVYLAANSINLRAAEFGKYIIRATDTGITKIIGPEGRAMSQINPNTRGFVIGNIGINNKQTFYSRYGNLVTNIILIITALTLFYARKNRNL